MKTFLRLPQVLEVTGLKQRTAYHYMALGAFPKPVRVGGTSMWVSEEIEAWQQEQIDARDKALADVEATRLTAADVLSYGETRLPA